VTDAYNNLSLIEGPTVAGSLLAAEFTPSADYSVTDVGAVLFTTSDALATATYYIYSGDGSAPGTMLAQVGPTMILTPLYELNMEVPAAPIDLSAGVNYWLVLALTDNVGWVLSGTVDHPFSYGASLGANSTQFVIEGIDPPATVPEPRQFVPMLLALAAIALRRSVATRRSH
jgi:hypothetical protein